MLYDCAVASCTLSSRQPSSIWVFAGSTSTSKQRRHLEHALRPQKSTHRVTIADMWRTSHHDGKISPGWWGWRVHAHPLSAYYHQAQSCSVNFSWEGRYTPCISPVPFKYDCAEKGLGPWSLLDLDLDTDPVKIKIKKLTFRIRIKTNAELKHWCRVRHHIR